MIDTVIALFRRTGQRSADDTTAYEAVELEDDEGDTRRDTNNGVPMKQIQQTRWRSSINTM